MMESASCWEIWLEASQGAFHYFWLKEEQILHIIIQLTDDVHKFFEPNVELDQIATWVNEFKVEFLY
ncbi:unnamed protein product [Rhodiola kirilowii]